MTRARRQCAAQRQAASAAARIRIAGPSQLAYTPPPLRPSLASPDHTVPRPASSRRAARRRASARAGTTVAGARVTPKASQSSSTTALSSSAIDAAVRGPRLGRPAISGRAQKGVVTNTTASWSGS